MKKELLIIILIFWGVMLQAQTAFGTSDSVKIVFKQSKIDIVPELGDNATALKRIADGLLPNPADSTIKLQKLLVIGGASPEGSIAFNKYLSENRANALFNYFSQYAALPDSLKSFIFLGRDWNGLIRLADNDPNIPFKAETLSLLREIAAEAQADDYSNGDHLQRIRSLHGGKPYAYMYANLFPDLRASRLYLQYEKAMQPIATSPFDNITLPPFNTNNITIPDTITLRPYNSPKPFYLDLRTNMLYDALLIPNIGVEFYLGKGYSILADWMYGWWKTDRTHWYWRAYGGGIALRKWFGEASKQKPLTGHHIGIYGNVFTYDFETGGRGQMGGKPGGTIMDKMNYAAGVEYGYSLPVARRLNIDFTIGVGYWGGTYYEYIPDGKCYVWQSTKRRHWVGPTKAEISLVWLIGRGNSNPKKGGRI